MLVGRVVAKLEPGARSCRCCGSRVSWPGAGHRMRLLAGIASPAGVELPRAHGVEPEVMGAAVDLQWHCDPAFVAWLEPRLGGADVVHAHMLGAWWAAAPALPAGVPLVASEHNGYAWWGEPPWAAMAEVAARVDRFYAHGPGARAGALRLGIPEDRVRACRRWWDWLPALGRGCRRRGSCSRAASVPDKGPDVLVDAVARMAAPPPVLMLGAGVLEHDLRARRAAWAGASVLFCGWVDEPGVVGRGCRRAGLPAARWRSRRRRCLRWASVRPCSAPTSTASRIARRPRGIVVASEDPQALARALEDVLAGRRRPDTAAARIWAGRFDADRVAAVYEHSYDELCRAAAS